jgi:hypothetical protein
MRFAQIEVALDSASCFVRELALTGKVIRPLPLGGDHQKFDFIVKLSKFLVPIIAAAVVLHMPRTRIGRRSCSRADGQDIAAHRLCCSADFHLYSVMNRHGWKRRRGRSTAFTLARLPIGVTSPRASTRRSLSGSCSTTSTSSSSILVVVSSDLVKGLPALRAISRSYSVIGDTYFIFRVMIPRAFIRPPQ